MMISRTMSLPEPSDSQLVAGSRAGDRSAFRQIVERYQTLVSSIAYSATGSLARSEDVAQETFIAAWTRLNSLREPEKLRGWLCGIVRNLLHTDRREWVREPVRRALELEHADEAHAPDALPSDQAVTREEEALLWHSLENIPPLYREPLVLFYRDHRSIEEVARSLELSTATVKQRLSRGRKLLKDEVQSLVEATLRRSVPGAGFSATVITMLPVAAPIAAAVGPGIGAKGSAVVKSGTAGSALLSLVPFLGIAAAIGAHWLVIQETVANPAARRRQFAHVIIAWTVYLGLAAGGEWAVHASAAHWSWSDRLHFTAAATYWCLFVGSTVSVQIAMIRRTLARRTRLSSPTSRNLATSQPPGRRTLSAVCVGGHLAMFSWFLALAWRYADTTGFTLGVSAMAVLCIMAYARARGAPATALLRIGTAQIGLVGVVIALLLNFRINAWLAFAEGVSVPEIHRLLPTWIVPVLTLALAAWILALSFLPYLTEAAKQREH